MYMCHYVSGPQHLPCSYAAENAVRKIQILLSSHPVLYVSLFSPAILNPAHIIHIVYVVCYIPITFKITETHIWIN